MLWCLLLFVLGVTLIVVEFFLPGGVCGILGIILLLVSTGIGISAYPDYALFIILGELLGAIGGIALGLYLLAKTGLGRGLFLDTTLPAENGFEDSAGATLLTGATGLVLTDLRPAGTIEVDGERIDAVSDGDLIEAGSLVHVLEVHGNRVVVEAMSSDAAENDMKE